MPFDPILNDVMSTLLAGIVLYFLARGAIKFWFYEKGKHMDRVLKKMNQGEMK